MALGFRRDRCFLKRPANRPYVRALRFAPRAPPPYVIASAREAEREAIQGQAKQSRDITREAWIAALSATARNDTGLTGAF